MSRIALVTVLVLALASPLFAQSDAEVNAGLEFNFGAPGARSLGVGGAFIGISDDATAAYTNPAGLLKIARPEVAIEGRASSYTNFFTDRGHAFGPPTMQGADTIAGVHSGESINRLGNLSFVSVVYPHRWWALAVYRHEVARFRSSARTSGVFFDRETQKNDGTTQISRFRHSPSISQLDLRVIGYGGSAAVRLTDELTAGISITHQWMALDSRTNRYAFDETAAANFDGQVIGVQEQHGRDRRTSFNAGVLWEINHRFTLGGAYRQGTSFDVRSSTSGVGLKPKEETGRFNVPAVLGVGLAYRPRDDRFTIISFDCDRIGYSQLTSGLVALNPNVDPSAYRISDGYEFHLGYERFIVPSSQRFLRVKYPLVVRVGAWSEPDHRLRYEVPGSAQSVLFRRGGTSYHGSVGAGVAIGRDLEVNAAYAYSRRQRTASISVVISR